MPMCVCVGSHPPGRARRVSPLGVEVHDAHHQDLLPRPHPSFDVPAERDDLPRRGAAGHSVVQPNGGRVKEGGGEGGGEVVKSESKNKSSKEKKKKNQFTSRGKYTSACTGDPRELFKCPSSIFCR